MTSPPAAGDSPHIGEYAFPSPQVRDCPFPFYEALRTEAPVYRLPGRDEFLVSRWEDIAWVAAHPELFGSAPREVDSAHRLRPELQTDGPRVFSPRSMGHSDPPEHKAKRALGLRLVTPAKLDGYAPMIERIVDGLLDSIADSGGVGRAAGVGRRQPRLREVRGPRPPLARTPTRCQEPACVRARDPHVSVSAACSARGPDRDRRAALALRDDSVRA